MNISNVYENSIELTYKEFKSVLHFNSFINLPCDDEVKCKVLDVNYKSKQLKIEII